MARLYFRVLLVILFLSCVSPTRGSDEAPGVTCSIRLESPGALGVGTDKQIVPGEEVTCIITFKYSCYGGPNGPAILSQDCWNYLLWPRSKRLVGLSGDQLEPAPTIMLVSTDGKPLAGYFSELGYAKNDFGGDWKALGAQYDVLKPRSSREITVRFKAKQDLPDSVSIYATTKAEMFGNDINKPVDYRYLIVSTVDTVTRYGASKDKDASSDKKATPIAGKSVPRPSSPVASRPQVPPQPKLPSGVKPSQANTLPPLSKGEELRNANARSVSLDGNNAGIVPRFFLFADGRLEELGAGVSLDSAYQTKIAEKPLVVTAQVLAFKEGRIKVLQLAVNGYSMSEHQFVRVPGARSWIVALAPPSEGAEQCAREYGATDWYEGKPPSNAAIPLFESATVRLVASGFSVDDRAEKGSSFGCGVYALHRTVDVSRREAGRAINTEATARPPIRMPFFVSSGPDEAGKDTERFEVLLSPTGDRVYNELDFRRTRLDHSPANWEADRQQARDQLERLAGSLLENYTFYFDVDSLYLCVEVWEPKSQQYLYIDHLFNERAFRAHAMDPYSYSFTRGRTLSPISSGQRIELLSKPTFSVELDIISASTEEHKLVVKGEIVVRPKVP